MDLDAVTERIRRNNPCTVVELDARDLVAEVCRLRADNERLTATIAAMDDDADQALTEKAEAVEAESQAADQIAAERDRAVADRDSFARMYARSIERYDDLGMGVICKIADGGSLADVLNFVGDSLNECDHVDAESITLWERAAAVVAALTEGGTE